MGKMEFDKLIDEIIRSVVSDQTYNMNDFSYTPVKEKIYKLIKQQIEGHLGSYKRRTAEIIDCHLNTNKGDN